MKYDKDKREIRLNRELSSLDKLVLDFVGIIERQVDYVIVSGYVSILLGRSRATEDIDLFIKKVTLEKFKELFNDIKEKGFECINAENPEEIFSYLEEGLAVRFARKGEAVPNFEVKFSKRKIDEETFSDFIIVVLSQGKLKISSLERQIAF